MKKFLILCSKNLDINQNIVRSITRFYKTVSWEVALRYYKSDSLHHRMKMILMYYLTIITYVGK